MRSLRNVAMMVVSGLVLLASSTPARASDADLDARWTITYTDTRVAVPNFAQSVAASRDYWGKLPACNDLHWRTMTIASASDSPIIAPDQPIAMSELGGCSMWLNPNYLELRWFTPQDLCVVTMHEIGHLLGYGHEEAGTAVDPQGVMNPDLNRFAIIPACSSDGKTRSPRRASDRAWCRRHEEKCAAKYPRLARAARTTKAPPPAHGG